MIVMRKKEKADVKIRRLMICDFEIKKRRLRRGDYYK